MRYRIDFLPKASRVPGLDEDQQRWTAGSVTVEGEEARDRELLAHEADYGPDLVFRGHPMPCLGDTEYNHYCNSCGGDLRERLGNPLSCTCPVAVASPSSVRWIRPVAKEKAS